MNYSNPELLDALAAQYVLGTLRGPARRRFARLAATLPEAREALERWERELSPLGNGLAPVEPSAELWRGVEQRLFEGASSPRAAGAVSATWRAFALAASVCCVALAALLFAGGNPAPQAPTHVAQIMADSGPLWVVGVDLESGQLNARALNVSAAELDRVFELWMLPASGQPQSLGLLPVGAARVERLLPAGLAAALRRADGLAVSIEPPGGSATGVPTGPVVYQAVLSEL